MSEHGNAVPVPTADDKILALVAHVSQYFGIGLLVGVVLMVLKKETSPFVYHHAMQVVIWGLLVMVGLIVTGLLSIVLIGIPLLLILGLMALIFPIVAAIKTLDGQYYEYPLTRWVTSRL